jgi:hypothetical protein
MISEIEIFKAINKHEVINKYLSNLISRKQAASELSCHENHIPRLVSKFEKENHESFFHKSNGTKKKSKISRFNCQKAVETYLYQNQFVIDAKQLPLSFSHFYDRSSSTFKKDYGESICMSSLAKIFNQNNVYAPYSRERKSISNPIHLRSDKKLPYGQQIEMDGAFGFALPEEENENLCFLICVDANDSQLLSGAIGVGETTELYVQAIDKQLKSTGVGDTYIGDNRKDLSAGLNDVDRKTMIGNGLRSLGAKLWTTSDPLCKPHVETSHELSRRRIMQELILLGATDIKSANDLMQTALANINAQLKKNMPDVSCYRKLPANYNCDNTFVKSDTRSIKDNHLIQFKNKLFVIYRNNSNEILTLKPGTVVEILYRNNKLMKVKYKGNSYSIEIANRDTIKNMTDTRIKSIRKKMFKDGVNFTFAKKKYHIPQLVGSNCNLDYDNKSISIYYDIKFDVTYVFVDKNKYSVKEGHVSNTIEHQSIFIEYKIKYNGTIKVGSSAYVFVDSKKEHFMPGEGEVFKVEFINNCVVGASYNNNYYIALHESVTRFFIPQSKLTAKRHFSNLLHI